LFHQFAKKKGVFNIWKNPIFWLKYIELEMQDKKLKQSNQVYLTLLSEVVFKLNDLNLDNKVIMSLVTEDLAVKLIDSVK